MTRSLVATALLVLVAGCTLVGPGTVRRARFDYGQEIARSWNEQLLLNLVRLRYRDPPQFLEVGSVLAQYGLSVGAGVSPTVNVNGTTRTAVGLGANVAYEERPTITYVPLQGEEFTRRMLTPTTATTIVLLSQTGWSIERLLLACIEQVNDLRNAPNASGPTPAVAPDTERFRELAHHLRELQIAEALHFEATATAEGERAELHIGAAESARDSAARVRELLGLPAGAARVRITSGLTSQGDGQIAVTARSLMGILFYLSHCVEVPEADERAGLVTVTRDRDGARFDWSASSAGTLRVRSGPRVAVPAFVAVPYRGHWFWLPDDDLDSKSTFFLLHYLLALKAGDSRSTPLLTVPAG